MRKEKGEGGRGELIPGSDPVGQLVLGPFGGGLDACKMWSQSLKDKIPSIESHVLNQPSDFHVTHV